MARPKFSDIFGACIGEELSAIVGDKYLEKCDLDIETRNLLLCINTENYISKETAQNIQNALKMALKLNSCQVEFLCDTILQCFNDDSLERRNS